MNWTKESPGLWKRDDGAWIERPEGKSYWIAYTPDGRILSYHDRGWAHRALVDCHYTSAKKAMEDVDKVTREEQAEKAAARAEKAKAKATK